VTDYSTANRPGTHAATHPDRPAVITGTGTGTGTVVTYAELEARSCRLAHALHHHGLRAGDHVAVVLPNDDRTHEVAWGLHRLGLYYTMVNSHLTADEAAYIVQDCAAKVLITSAVLGTLPTELADRTPGVDLRLCLGADPVDGHLVYDAFVAGHPDTPLPDETEGSAMLYSSGTTGRPKGIRRALTGHPLGADSVLAPMLTHLMGFAEGDRYLSPAPLYHSAPLVWSMTVQRLGGTVVLMERFDPEECLRLIARHEVTHAQFVPTMFVRMLKLPDATRASYDVSSLRSVVHAAAPCAPEVKRRMLDWWGPVIQEYYSGTEGGGMTWVNAEDWLAHPGTVGRPIYGEVHICDDDGHELGPDTDGVVWFAGPAAAFEYNNDPEKTRQTFNDRGWSTLWDVGHLDTDGFLYLTDRKLFMIVSGGVNIYPQEIEDVLVLHPSVGDVAVFGVPDPDMGEAVKAVVQPSPGAAAGPELAAELLAFCRDHLSHFKCPRSVDFTDAMPRGENGKLYKKPLRDAYWASSTAT
jgi:acyl-CoA synthetase (AMP-forming)/AMP-acid ligase II